MKIVIIGPGALGSLFAATLAAGGGNDVWLLDHDPDRAAVINGRLLLTSAGGEYARPVSATADSLVIGPADVVLVCVKSRDVEQGLKNALPILEQHTTLVTFQNGISHLDALGRIPLPLPPAIGVTALGATLKGPGHVCHGGSGITRMGFPDAVSPARQDGLDRVIELFRQAGLEAQSVRNILDFVWAKLLVNVGINALTVIHDCRNGALLDIPAAREDLVRAVEEGMRVASSLHITLPDDPVGQALAVCRATADNISSTLQDVRRRRPTEIEAINGALLKKGEDAGIDMPVNRKLVERIKEIEAGYLRKAPHASGLRRP